MNLQDVDRQYQIMFNYIHSKLNIFILSVKLYFPSFNLVLIECTLKMLCPFYASSVLVFKLCTKTRLVSRAVSKIELTTFAYFDYEINERSIEEIYLLDLLLFVDDPARSG